MGKFENGEKAKNQEVFCQHWSVGPAVAVLFERLCKQFLWLLAQLLK